MPRTAFARAPTETVTRLPTIMTPMATCENVRIGVQADGTSVAQNTSRNYYDNGAC